MIKWLKRKYKQLICSHLYTTEKPIMNPLTWDMEIECGKCGHIKNCNGWK